MYNKTTQDITVSVEPVYLEDQSFPRENHFFWAYRVCIKNESARTVCLRARYWKITDSNGITQEVEGDGVVGEQPVLGPGEAFEYTSGTPLNTPSGIMVGSYRMEAGEDGEFKVDIPAFSLDSPYQSSVIH